MDGESKRFVRQRLIVFGVVLGLLLVLPTQDLLSGLTKPLVVFLLSSIGWSASDLGGQLVAGPLTVEWTPDCSGIDILLVLWVLMFWSVRHEKVSQALFLRLAATVPVAVAVNAGRVLFFIFWRKVFYPAVETPELHFFVGFLMLIPLVLFFIPRSGTPFSHHLVQMSYLAAVISLVAIHAGGPGGILVTLCAIGSLGLQRPQLVRKTSEKVFLLLWMLAVCWVALTTMESMWLPLLLVAPWFGGMRLLGSPAVFLVMGTIPVLASTIFWLPLLGILWASWRFLALPGGFANQAADANLRQFRALGSWGTTRVKESPEEPSSPGRASQTGWSPSTGLTWRAALVLLAVIPLPFVASSFTTFSSGGDGRPPRGLMSRALNSGGYAIRMLDQSPDIRLYWYGSLGGGRHHSLPVCMRYRGVRLKPADGSDGAVLTDGDQWMTEGFLFEDGSLVGTKAYLLKTFLPLTDPGVHLIAVAGHQAMTPDAFLQAARLLFEETAERQRSQATLRESRELEGSGLAAR